MPFKAGQPRPKQSGRPKGVKNVTLPEVKLAYMKDWRIAKARLLEHILGSDAPISMAAIKEYNDRAMGKPVQPIAAMVENTGELVVRWLGADAMEALPPPQVIEHEPLGQAGVELSGPRPAPIPSRVPEPVKPKVENPWNYFPGQLE